MKPFLDQKEVNTHPALWAALVLVLTISSWLLGRGLLMQKIKVLQEELLQPVGHVLPNRECDTYALKQQRGEQLTQEEVNHLSGCIVWVNGYDSGVRHVIHRL